MVHRTRQDSTHDTERSEPQRRSDPEARARAVGSMVSASLMALLGTLIFAWALRAPDYPWLFAAGALPWITGVAMFARAVWRYTRLQ